MKKGWCLTVRKRRTFSYLKGDMIDKWLTNQNNKMYSVKLLIETYIKKYGFIDFPTVVLNAFLEEGSTHSGSNSSAVKREKEKIVKKENCNYTITFPEDSDIDKWFSKQVNGAMSLKMALTYWIRIYGYNDLPDLLMEGFQRIHSTIEEMQPIQEVENENVLELEIENETDNNAIQEEVNHMMGSFFK